MMIFGVRDDFPQNHRVTFCMIFFLIKYFITLISARTKPPEVFCHLTSLRAILGVFGLVYDYCAIIMYFVSQF